MKITIKDADTEEVVLDFEFTEDTPERVILEFEEKFEKLKHLIVVRTEATFEENITLNIATTPTGVKSITHYIKQNSDENND